jgi:flagellar hook-basal body complex protein FliE
VDDEKYSPQEIAFAREVARRREKLGLTLGEMAAKLRDEGIDYASSMTVSRTEKLQRPTRMSEALAYARIFKSSVDEMTRAHEVDRRVREASELAQEASAYVRQVVISVQKAHFNWAKAMRLRDELLAIDVSELTHSQVERRALALEQLERIIDLDLIGEMSKAWHGAPRL